MAESAVLSGVFTAAAIYCGTKWGVGIANHIPNPYFGQVVAENALPVAAVAAVTMIAIRIWGSPAPTRNKKAALSGAVAGAALFAYIGGGDFADYQPKESLIEDAAITQTCDEFADGFFKPAFCP